jgi:hypothetical protein
MYKIARNLPEATRGKKGVSSTISEDMYPADNFISDFFSSEL